MALEQLLILVIFILLPLINWALQRSRRGRDSEPQAPRPPRPLPEARRARQEPTARVAVPQATAERLSMPQATPPPPADFWRHDLRRRLVPRTRQELRHAIIMMTILGPCRALEPPREGTGYSST